jgi:L-asparagine transporter-like permease
MWLYPGLTWVALVSMAGVFVLMLRQPGTRDQLLATGVLTLALAIAGFVHQKQTEKSAKPVEPVESAQSTESVEPAKSVMNTED